MKRHEYERREAHADNSTFTIGGVSYSADSFVVTKNSVLNINICAEKSAYLKSAQRYRYFYGDSATSNCPALIKRLLLTDQDKIHNALFIHLLKNCIVIKYGHYTFRTGI